MPLIDCKACGNQISIEATSCPQCGHPNRYVESGPTASRCYRCNKTATTKCHRCEKLTCEMHSEVAKVRDVKDNEYFYIEQTLCDACYSQHVNWKWFVYILIAVAIIVSFVVMYL